MRRLPTIALAGVLILAAPAFAAAQPGTPDRFERTSAGIIDSSFKPGYVSRDSTVKVMVQMSKDPVAVVQANRGRALSASEKKAAKATVEAQQASLKKYVASKGGKVISSVQSAYNGVKVTVKRSELKALATQPGVVALRPVEIMTFENATSVPFLGVPEVWESTGYTGDGVKVAIIDTGIDYTHADFGGPGTVEAYEAAHAAETSPANPALFGPAAPRVKGGIDLVGDDYNANVAGSMPVPDLNPLDCNGHGSHVAGTVGGSGVNLDGSTYEGAYDTTTPSNTFRVGPGVAPEVDLYAVRVFGCDGSTDVTVEAIDWAVANDMDVINMSLGSSFGRSTDPSAVASANAVAAGVIVVASAGNSGPNPYITGSPGVGQGVIAVAATDSTAEFPGVSITLPGGASIPAMNANGAAIPATPFNVVVLKDDPATAENEALGCSVDAYTKNGIVAGGNQIAVNVRGTCARVARAVFGQQAGAAAVAMVNTTAAFPPYEGVITGNPDVPGDVYAVTIPFLGVRGVLGSAATDDGDALVAADGGSLTLASTLLENPGFRNYASFSSGGTGNADSGLSPAVSAPGVSIASVAVGTGSDAAIMSGTSMAAPHVAGQAALVKEAHPTWSTADLSAAITSTADRSSQLDYRLTLGGQGLVDVAQSVSTSVVALGDKVAVGNTWVNDTGLSFGFAEIATTYSETRAITLVNNSGSAKDFALEAVKTAQSAKAEVTLSSTSVRVDANDSVEVNVTLAVAGSDVYDAAASVAGQFDFKEVSGSIVATSDADILAVPYLLVPRAQSNLTATASTTASGVRLSLSNSNTTVPAGVDVYTWGLSDPQDAGSADASGFDLRAVGVQSFTSGRDALLVFAVNNWDRASNHAINEFDIVLDTNTDGRPDWIVFSADSGAVRSGTFNGLTEVFTYNLRTDALSSSGYLAEARTDTSTVLLPVLARDVGVNTKFRYSAASYSGENGSSDTVAGSSLYNPWLPAIADGGWFEVPAGGTASGVVALGNFGQLTNKQKPRGVMLVALDNEAGAPEALLVPVK